MPESQAPRPVRRRLGNGLGLLLLSRPGAARAAISLRVAAGSHDEPAAYPGLAHFLEHLVFLGSAAFAPEQGLMAYVQGCGGQVNASTQARHTDYFCEVPADRLDGALARMLDMLARPLLEPAAQRREREVLHAEFLARGQDADTLLDAALGQALPVDHRGAAFLAGNRDSLPVDSAAFQQALRAFHRRFYRAGQLSLVLAGPQSCAELLSLARRHGDSLPASARQVQAAPPSLLPCGRGICAWACAAASPVCNWASPWSHRRGSGPRRSARPWGCSSRSCRPARPGAWRPGWRRRDCAVASRRAWCIATSVRPCCC
ncbi:insulinase family protein [Pseudomonas lalucatii]|nr:insulinase family protein [Pseudomonas lalucatii]